MTMWVHTYLSAGPEELEFIQKFHLLHHGDKEPPPPPPPPPSEWTPFTSWPGVTPVPAEGHTRSDILTSVPKSLIKICALTLQI